MTARHRKPLGRRILAALGTQPGRPIVAVFVAALVVLGVGTIGAHADSTQADGAYGCSFTAGTFNCSPTALPTTTVTTTQTATVTATATTTVTASPPPAKMLVGESFGGSSAASVSSATTQFPEQTVGRYYFSGDPDTFANTPGLAATKTGETLIVSFKTTYSKLTGGTYDAALESILTDWNASGHTIYVVWQHEPENNGLTSAQFVAGWNHLIALIAAVPHANLHSMTTIISDDIRQGTQESWYVPGVEVLGFDDYQLDNEPRSLAYAASKGKPLMFPEVGDGTVSGPTDADSLAFAQSFEAGLNSTVLGWAWYDASNNALTGRPNTLAYLRTLP